MEGGDEVQKKHSCKGKFCEKKNYARQVNLKNIHALFYSNKNRIMEM